MKRIFFLCVVLAFTFSTAFFNTSCSCNPPGCREVVRCDQYGNNCHVVRERRFLVESNFQTTNFSANQYVGIIDLSNEWQIDQSQPMEASIKFENQNTLLSQNTFQLSLAPTQSSTIPRIDKMTRPIAFVFSDPNAVSNFLNNLSSQNYANTTATISFSIPVSQISCNMQSGEFLNHFRYLDSTGVTYDRSFTIVYETVPSNQPICNNGTITIK
jgi:hypothetical protein